MSKKQTAVDFIEKSLIRRNYRHIVHNKEIIIVSLTTLQSIFEQAKEMEKEQIIHAANQTEFEDEDGLGIYDTISKGEQYYNETYGEEN